MSKTDIMSLLTEEIKSYDEIVELHVDINGQQIPIKMFPFFKPEKIRDCVAEIVDFFKKCHAENITIKQEEEDDVIQYFIIKHFTDIKMTAAKKAKSIIKEYKIVVNTTLYNVLTKSFPKESIQKVYDRLFDLIETTAELENNFKKYKDAIKNLPLENKELLNIE